MDDEVIDELTRKVLSHLYDSAVVGSISSISLILGMKAKGVTMNPRFQDLRALFDELGEEKRRLFYEGVIAISEFAVFSFLDFVEMYSRFDSEENDGPYPHLSLIYREASSEDAGREISEFGSKNLGQLFKKIARLDEMRALVEEAIDRKAPA